MLHLRYNLNYSFLENKYTELAVGQCVFHEIEEKKWKKKDAAVQ